MNNLARFLIKYDRGIDEGMNLIDNALKLSPDNECVFMEIKVLGVLNRGNTRKH